ncbi:AAA family ATPase [Bradyrhizobium yuanmingense]|uniref:AAA family ATPase n=1 Tax=Bradyrhizobium yuanmingense TaxID=108015 RepID=UPI0023B8BE68|nr:AAA family ATPase [Bradyrhizobium yuanmingense]MDF0498258.1 AAA family ATPase [Bradyrhizobium yuanmingense]
MKQLESMGPLEAATYRRLWRSSRRFLVGLLPRDNSVDSGGDLQAGVGGAKERPQASASDRITLRELTERVSSPERRSRTQPQRQAANPDDDQVLPHRAAAALTFARIFDQRPDVLRSIYEGAPTILIDVADSRMLREVKAVWEDVLADGYPCPADRRQSTKPDVTFMLVEEAPKPSLLAEYEQIVVEALGRARSIIGISPMARSHLPDILLRAASAHITFPSLDQATIARVIRIATTMRCYELIDDEIAKQITPSDLVIAVRFDRTPGECVAGLRRLYAARQAMKGPRELTLADLHGLGEARAWAESAISDIKAWQAGGIPWSQVPSGIALSGPPGCGKTTFAAVFCHEAGLHMVSATLAKWQSTGEAHLGHLLRAMRKDFEEARANAPSCVFIDEIDSFPIRAGVTHAHRDYVVEVVNALLAEIDGIKGREGVVVIGASNHLARCEPALLRSGRLEKIVKIGLPDIIELERMFRVRLRDDLVHEDLSAIVQLAIGMVGADVERIVKDARRFARQAGNRSLILQDLRNAIVRPDHRSLELRWRHCIHEAGHLLADVILLGPDGAFATMARIGPAGGMSVRTVEPARFFGTPDDYRRRLQVMLAGRAGEEVILGTVSHGAGGQAGLGSDLEEATLLAAEMVGQLGLAGADHLTHLGAQSVREYLVFDEVRSAIARELTAAAKAVAALLEANRKALENAARHLLDDGRLAGSDAAQIIKRFGEQQSNPWTSGDKVEMAGPGERRSES